MCPAVTYTKGHEKIHAENTKNKLAWYMRVFLFFIPFFCSGGPAYAGSPVFYPDFLNEKFILRIRFVAQMIPSNVRIGMMQVVTSIMTNAST